MPWFIQFNLKTILLNSNYYIIIKLILWFSLSLRIILKYNNKK